MQPSNRTLISLVLMCLSASPLVFAQSELARNATPVVSGLNRGTADSFQGDHGWYFFAEPGTFKVVFSLGSMTGDSAIAATPNVGMIFAEKFNGNSFTTSKSGTATIFSGTIAKAVKVYMLVEAPPGKLVRSARNYTIEATGNVRFGELSTDPLIGTYISKRNDYGTTKFLANGNVVTSSGASGKWVLFDGNLHLYTITIDRDRFSAKWIAGRGLIDPANDVVLFEIAR